MKRPNPVPALLSCPAPSQRTAALWRGVLASASFCRHFWGSLAVWPWWWSSVAWSPPLNRLKTWLQVWATPSDICHVVLTGCAPSASVWSTCVYNEVNGHVWKCIIVLVHLSHSHSRGHKSTQPECHRNGVIGTAPYKSIASLYIINQRCMEISEGMEGERQHPHPDNKQHRSTVTSHFTALHCDSDGVKCSGSCSTLSHTGSVWQKQVIIVETNIFTKYFPLNWLDFIEYQRMLNILDVCRPTVLFCRLIIHLAHQPPVLHEVKLVPGGQLSAAHDAGKAVQVIHKVLRLPHHLRRRDPLLAWCTFCSKTSAGKHEEESCG